jgi:ornithine cyclodeaminase
MTCLVLGAREVEELLPVPECIDVMAEALASLARGELHQPLRTIVRPPGAPSFMALMPASRVGGERPLHALKALVLAPDNPARGLDAHQGAVTLFDGVTGEVRAIVDASAITAIRTAAVSGVATRALAREDARTLAILGAGVQARAHVEAMRAVRAFESIRAYAPTLAHVETLGVEVAASAEQCVRGADVVVTATTSSEPVLRREWLKPGAHVNAVGASTPDARELDAQTIAAATLVVDRRESALAESGDYALALADGAISGPEHIVAELAEVLVGKHPGRTSAEELTVFKSLGLAVEDLAAAEAVVARARESGFGVAVDL